MRHIQPGFQGKCIGEVSIVQRGGMGKGGTRGRGRMKSGSERERKGLRGNC